MSPNKKSKYKRGVCWLRRDLRIQDHHALSEATLHCDEVAVIFVFDTTILNKIKNKSDRRMTFIQQSLQEVKEYLESQGSKLITLHGNPIQEVPELCQSLDAQALFLNEDYEPQAKERDEKVKEILWKKGIRTFSFKDQVIFSGSELKKGDGTPYKVFTPYKKAWLKKISDDDLVHFNPNKGKFISSSILKKYPSSLSLQKYGFEDSPILVAGGESQAQKSFRAWQGKIEKYSDERDYPSLDGNSYLSPHLRFGTLSIRQLVKYCLEHPSKGADVWLSELIWREFYQMILDQFPDVESEAFLKKYRSIKWPGKPAHLTAWIEGRTGYPIVDAAMRYFNKTGWMHNRLRMIVASFLVKDLLIDWKEGEKYFAKNLLDYDLASNNGGWQWCASTGCDAQPYFRIFNPTSQSKRFDPDGKFIREHIPELKLFPNRYIHEPSLAPLLLQKESDCIIGKDYPAPIIQHDVQRAEALSLYKRT